MNGISRDSYIGVVKGYWENIREPKSSKERGTHKKEIIEELVSSINKNFSYVKGFLDHINDVKDSLSRRFDVIDVNARLVFRGRPGSGELLIPLEWGLLIHPVFLVPYFPGSAIKGALRASYCYMLTQYHNLPERGDCDNGPDAVQGCVRALFGDTDPPFGVGGVRVLDSFPVEAGKVGIVVGDVITPHYKGGELITELDVVPTPITGISVAEGTLFRFLVLIDTEYISWVLEKADIPPNTCGMGKGIATAVAAALINALENMGLGGKTTRGYGFFEINCFRLLPLNRRHLPSVRCDSKSVVGGGGDKE